MIKEQKTVTISLLISGVFVTGYMFSLIYMDKQHKPSSNTQVVTDNTFTTKNHEVIMEQKVDKQIPKVVVKKEKVTTKLKPRHLYVRNSEEIERDMSRRKRVAKDI